MMKRKKENNRISEIKTIYLQADPFQKIQVVKIRRRKGLMLRKTIGI